MTTAQVQVASSTLQTNNPASSSSALLKCEENFVIFSKIWIFSQNENFYSNLSTFQNVEIKYSHFEKSYFLGKRKTYSWDFTSVNACKTLAFLMKLCTRVISRPDLFMITSLKIFQPYKLQPVKRYGSCRGGCVCAFPLPNQNIP